MFFSEVMYTVYGTKYSRMHEVKLWRPPSNFSKAEEDHFFQISYLFKGCLPQILLGPFLNILSKMYRNIRNTNLSITRLRKMFTIY